MRPFRRRDAHDAARRSLPGLAGPDGNGEFLHENPRRRLDALVGLLVDRQWRAGLGQVRRDGLRDGQPGVAALFGGGSGTRLRHCWFRRTGVLNLVLFPSIRQEYNPSILR